MVSLCPGYVTYLFLTRSPLYVQSKSNVPFDLHVLATPPAFVLSQDQTLRFNSLNTRHLAAPHVLCELTRRTRAKAQTRQTQTLVCKRECLRSHQSDKSD